jgi:two-component system phosphate regulon sensor histidine kinase PhoR
MKRYVSNLVLTLLVLIGVFVFATGIFAANQLESNQLQLVKQNLERQLATMRSTLVWEGNDPLASQMQYLQGKADQWQTLTKLRVTFIDLNGEVLADSAEEAATMSNHRNRPEMQQTVKTGGIAFATRLSETTGKKMVYAAMPVTLNGDTIGYLRLSTGTEEIDNSVRQLWMFTLLGMFIALLIAGVFGFRMGSKITNPITEINNAAEQIMRMNFNVKVNVESQDEIGRLGLTVNTIAENFNRQMGRILESERQLSNVMENMVSGVVMLDREGKFVLLNRSAEELLGYNFSELRGKVFFESHQQSEFVAMVAESFEREERQREELMFYYPRESMMEVNIVPMYQKDDAWVGMLIVLNDITAIRRLEKMRSEFVANVSHELKTPIAAIKGFAETILSGAVQDQPTMESFLKIIFDESNRLDRLVMDILDLSKIESKRIPLFFSPIHLETFIVNTVNMMRQHADSKKITVKIDIPEDIYLEADEDRLRQIVINLLSNGINYTPNGGKVIVSAIVSREEQHGAESVRICFEDTGLGIPKKDLPRIFERFYRVDKARSRVSGGTGLGLSIVKYLVELHNGSIHVQSELGVGSKFILDLPILHEQT